MTNRILFMLAAVTLMSLTQGQVPEFFIELTDPPEQRFNEVISFFSTELSNLYNSFPQLLSQEIINDFTSNATTQQFIDQERFAEMQGIANALGVDIGLVAIGNFLDYFFDSSTIVLAMLPDGSVVYEKIHDSQVSLFKQLTFKARFLQGGFPWYEAEMIAGEVGIRSGIWNQTFAMTYTRRDRQEPIVESPFSLLSFDPHPSWQMRYLVENCNDYNCGIVGLIELPVAFECHYIFAGVFTYDGIVFTRNYYSVDNMIMLSLERPFMVQTTEDHFLGICSEKCQQANSLLVQIDPALVTEDDIKNQVMFVDPILSNSSISWNSANPSLSSFELEIIQ